MEKKLRNSANVFRNVVLCFSFVIMTISGALLLKQMLIDPMLSDNNLKKISEISNKKNEFSERNFNDLLKINSDIKGWIKIDDTPIDYPVLQSSQENPEFYLNKNYKKEKDNSGSIFINSYYSMFDNKTQNVVMHGHSMKNGRMFGALLKYSSLDFYKNHPIIDFDTIYESGKWKIFAIIKTNSKEEDGPIFNYFIPNFNSQYEFLEFIYEIKIRSILDIPVDIAKNDKIISLSTCSYEMDGFRTVVFARKIRENESENINFEDLRMNKNPLMPEIWYKKNKKTIPKFPTFDQALKKI